MAEGSSKGRKIKGVLFDFDGTLTRPGALDFPAIKREIDCPEGTPILEYLETLQSARKSELLKILESREEEAAQASRPNGGAEECLIALKKKGIPFGILTRNSLKSIHTAMEHFECIRAWDFAAIVTRDDSLPKPHPDGVFQAARQMGIPAPELALVGDFRFDVMAGKAAQAITVLLNPQGRNIMAHGDPEPDYTVQCLNELLDLVDSAV
jgi:hydrogenase expression/formation protein HypE